MHPVTNSSSQDGRATQTPTSEPKLLSRHRLRRITQTPKTFSNWYELLLAMAKGRIGRGPSVLRFRTRTGLTIECPNVPGARVPVYEIFAEDCYRLDWFLGELANRPIRVVDIGGHVGTFACRLAQLHPQASIECFEPSTTTASFLRGNVERNGLSARITVDERAVAAHTGVAYFDDNGAASGMNGLVQGEAQDTSGSTEVPTVAFDEVARSAAAPIDFLKIDCEGGEYDLVFGSSPQMWDSVQRVVLEYHPHPVHTWAELRDWFAERGLTVVAHEPADERQGTAWLSR